MKSIIIRIAKRYIIKTVNELLEDNRENVATVTKTINVWIERLSKILDCLKRINARVSDGKLEDEEVETSISEVEKLIKEF